MRFSKWLMIIVLLLGIHPAIAQPNLSDTDIVKLINQPFKDSPLYEEVNLSPQSRRPMDLNGDGTSEVIVIPISGCGATNNCAFFILQPDKKAWKLLLYGQGKITSLSPNGFIPTPRKTQGWPDLVTVFDQGPEANGTRSLDRKVYVFNGQNYELFTDAYPPEAATADLAALMQKIDRLKFEKSRIKAFE